MDAIFSCPRGHTFRVHTDEAEMRCPEAIGYDGVIGETSYCPEIAYRVGPRADVLALHAEVLAEIDTLECCAV